MSANNPFSLALNFQRELLETAIGSAERSAIASEQADRIKDVEVGQTPSTVVYEENKLELLHYESRTDDQHGTPILIVYALINKPFILDLQPNRSVVRRLLDAGHDVYLIDWNEPSRLDQHLTLDDYVNRYIDNCVDVVRERSGADRINLLGYCMGGTMTAIYTALHQQKVRALGLMAAGLCFDDTGGTLELWGDNEYYDPRDVVDVYGNVPAEMLDIGFALMDPIANYVSKYVRLYDNLENDDFVENFARMERWLGEGIDVAGETYVQFLEDIYQDNKLYRNELYVADKHVDVSGIDIPICLIIGEYDHLIPAETSKPFKDVVGTDDVTVLEQPTGHIGLSVSGSSHSDLWPAVSEWYFENSPESPPTLDSAAADASSTAAEAVEIAIDDDATKRDDTTGSEPKSDPEMEGRDPQSDVETDSEDDADGTDLQSSVSGIGPTYAERLREAGIEAVEDLASTDPEEIAEIADVGVTRAADWHSQANSQ